MTALEQAQALLRAVADIARGLPVEDRRTVVFALHDVACDLAETLRTVTA